MTPLDEHIKPGSIVNFDRAFTGALYHDEMQGEKIWKHGQGQRILSCIPEGLVCEVTDEELQVNETLYDFCEERAILGAGVIQEQAV